MLLYYITDRKQFPGTSAQQLAQILTKIADAAHAGIDFIQLREKDLPVRDLEHISKDAVQIVRQANSDRRDSRPATRLLINSRTDVALACGADGVHLTSNDISPADARSIAVRVARPEFFVGVSCHSPHELRIAESHGADFAVLAPIFGKRTTGAPGLGLNPLHQVSAAATPDHRVEAGDARTSMPVLALGGITLQNAKKCVGAGAAGIAGISLFQENDIAEVVRSLRAL